MDKDVKSAKGGVKKRKLSPDMESEPKGWLRSGKKRSDDVGQSEISKMNSDGISSGKGKKRKLSTIEETLSKRRLHSEDRDHPNETVAKESAELSNFNLPTELLTKIINMIPISQWASLELVNHQFQDVMHGLWGQLREIRLDELVYNKEKGPFPILDKEKIKVDSSHVLEEVLEKFLIRAPNVTSISDFAVFCHYRSIRPEAIQLLSKFQHLQTIDFPRGRLVGSGDFATFLEWSASRQSWKRLNMFDGIYQNCSWEAITSRRAVSRRNQPTTNLESVKCNMKYLDHFDRFLPIQWTGLKKLVVVDNYFNAKEVLLVIRKCTQLVHLAFGVPKCGNGNGNPSYDNLMQAVADLENLSVLKIIGYSSLDDAFYDALLVRIQDLFRRGITHLALVDFYCSDQIMDQIVGSIIDHLPRLKSLELVVKNCATASLLRLANRMGQLETLKLHYHVVDDSVIRAIGGNMGNLQCLHLHYPSITSVDFDFTPLGNLGKLKELRIIGRSTSIKSVTLKTWARMGFGSCMETLELSLQKGIAPKVVGSFFKTMARLHSLKLSESTWGSLEAIVEFCPRLTDLQLSSCSSTFSPTRIQSVIDGCSNLKNLYMFGYSWFPAALKVGKYRKITFKNLDVTETVYKPVVGLPS